VLGSCKKREGKAGHWKTTVETLGAPGRHGNSSRRGTNPGRGKKYRENDSETGTGFQILKGKFVEKGRME